MFLSRIPILCSCLLKAVPLGIRRLRWGNLDALRKLILGFLAAKLDKKYENRGMLGVKKHVNVYRFLRNYFGFSHLTFSFSHLMASLLHIF